MATTRKISVLILLFFFLLCTTSCAGASNCKEGINPNTWLAASVSYDDVNHCVNTCANYGDTVIFPAGEASWPTTLTITKGIHLKGAGKDKTIISYSGNESGYPALISFSSDSATASNNYPFTMGGFTLKAGRSNPYSLLSLTNTDLAHPMTRIVVNENRFIQSTSGKSRMAVRINSAVYGVAYNNEIINGSHAWRFFGRNKESWERGDKFEYGGQRVFYFEDNIVSFSEGASGGAMISGGHGGRHVTRYNTFQLANIKTKSQTGAFDQHGNQPKVYGTIGTEIYGNLRLYGNTGRWHDLRGGQCLMFYNLWNGATRSPWIHVREEYDDKIGPGGPLRCTGDRDCIQRVHNSYIWNNRSDGTLINPNISIQSDDACKESTLYQKDCGYCINSDKNFWIHEVSFDGTTGIGCGELAKRPATCITGTAYWVPAVGQEGTCIDPTGYVGAAADRATDPVTGQKVHIKGTLYKCTSTDTWEAYYTPYTYPHPLR